MKWKGGGSKRADALAAPTSAGAEQARAPLGPAAAVVDLADDEDEREDEPQRADRALAERALRFLEGREPPWLTTTDDEYIENFKTSMCRGKSCPSAIVCFGAHADYELRRPWQQYEPFFCLDYNWEGMRCVHGAACPFARNPNELFYHPACFRTTRCVYRSCSRVHCAKHHPQRGQLPREVDEGRWRPGPPPEPVPGCPAASPALAGATPAACGALPLRELEGTATAVLAAPACCCGACRALLFALAARKLAVAATFLALLRRAAPALGQLQRTVASEWAMQARRAPPPRLPRLAPSNRAPAAHVHGRELPPGPRRGGGGGPSESGRRGARGGGGRALEAARAAGAGAGAEPLYALAAALGDPFAAGGEADGRLRAAALEAARLALGAGGLSSRQRAHLERLLAALGPRGELPAAGPPACPELEAAEAEAGPLLRSAATASLRPEAAERAAAALRAALPAAAAAGPAAAQRLYSLLETFAGRRQLARLAALAPGPALPPPAPDESLALLPGLRELPTEAEVEAMPSCASPAPEDLEAAAAAGLPRALALDLEWPPSAGRDQPPAPTALVQVASPNVCALFRTCALGGAPGALGAVLEEAGAAEGGVLSGEEGRRVREGLGVACELTQPGPLAARALALRHSGPSLALPRLLAPALPRPLRKEHARSAWGAGELSAGQVEYAAADAWGPLLVFLEAARPGASRAFLRDPDAAERAHSAPHFLIQSNS
eukprot:tig00021590_g22767.t1